MICIPHWWSCQVYCDSQTLLKELSSVLWFSELIGGVVKCIVTYRRNSWSCQVSCDLHTSLVKLSSELGFTDVIDRVVKCTVIYRTHWLSCQVHCDLQNSLAEFPSVLWFAELFGAVPKCIVICRNYLWSCQVYSVVGKMTTFDLWPIPLGEGAWGAGTNMWHPETPASYESLPAPLATQIPTLWVHSSGGRGRGEALILDRCRAFDLFASVNAHLWVYCDLQDSLVELSSLLWFAKLFGRVVKCTVICRTLLRGCQVYCDLFAELICVVVKRIVICRTTLVMLTCLFWCVEPIGGVPSVL